MEENKPMQIGRQFHKDFFEGGMEQAKQNLIKQIDMNTQENNKLIAEFMGYELGVTETMILPSFIHGVNLELFETSWDYLMPVVEKIRKVTSYDRDKFSTEVIIYGNKTTIKSGGYGEKRHSNLFFNKTELGTWNTIEPTYQAVVEFIKWYNETK